MMMGKYKKFSTDRLGVSSYKRGIYMLYKYYAGSTHTTWLVSCGLIVKKLCLPCLIAVSPLEKTQRNNLFSSRLVPIMDSTNTKVGLNIAIVGRKHVQNFVKSRIGIIGRQLKMTQLEHGAKIQNSMSSAV